MFQVCSFGNYLLGIQTNFSCQAKMFQLQNAGIENNCDLRDENSYWSCEYIFVFVLPECVVLNVIYTCRDHSMTTMMNLIHPMKRMVLLMTLPYHLIG